MTFRVSRASATGADWAEALDNLLTGLEQDQGVPTAGIIKIEAFHTDPDITYQATWKAE